MKGYVKLSRGITVVFIPHQQDYTAAKLNAVLLNIDDSRSVHFSIRVRSSKEAGTVISMTATEIWRQVADVRLIGDESVGVVVRILVLRSKQIFVDRPIIATIMIEDLPRNDRQGPISMVRMKCLTQLRSDSVG